MLHYIQARRCRSRPIRAPRTQWAVPLTAMIDVRWSRVTRRVRTSFLISTGGFVGGSPASDMGVATLLPRVPARFAKPIVHDWISSGQTHDYEELWETRCPAVALRSGWIRPNSA